jgi:hypothetical protein
LNKKAFPQRPFAHGPSGLNKKAFPQRPFAHGPSGLNKKAFPQRPFAHGPSGLNKKAFILPRFSRFEKAKYKGFLRRQLAAERFRLLSAAFS